MRGKRRNRPVDGKGVGHSAFVDVVRVRVHRVKFTQSTRVSPGVVGSVSLCLPKIEDVGATNDVYTVTVSKRRRSNGNLADKPDDFARCAHAHVLVILDEDCWSSTVN